MFSPGWRKIQVEVRRGWWESLEAHHQTCEGDAEDIALLEAHLAKRRK